jgi:hypothetical protein
MSPAIGRTVPLNPGLAAVRTAARPLHGGRSTGTIAWRRRAPRAPFRQRLAQWRARHWRRAVLAWFVLSLIIVGVAAEPATAFPRAQLRSVPAAREFLRVAGALTVAGVPVLLVALS